MAHALHPVATGRRLRAAIFLTGREMGDIGPELAAALGVSVRVFQRIVAGERPLPEGDEALRTLAEKLDVPETFLRYGFDVPYDAPEAVLARIEEKLDAVITETAARAGREEPSVGEPAGRPLAPRRDEGPDGLQ